MLNMPSITCLSRYCMCMNLLTQNNAGMKGFYKGAATQAAMCLTQTKLVCEKRKHSFVENLFVLLLLQTFGSHLAGNAYTRQHNICA